VVNFTPLPLYSRGKNPRYPLVRRLGGFQSRSGRGGEGKKLYHALTGNWTPDVQPIAWSLYGLSYPGCHFCISDSEFTTNNICDMLPVNWTSAICYACHLLLFKNRKPRHRSWERHGSCGPRRYGSPDHQTIMWFIRNSNSTKSGCTGCHAAVTRGSLMKQPESKEVNRKQKRHLSWPKEKKKKKSSAISWECHIDCFLGHERRHNYRFRL
jgi:hypothetical protein